MQKTTYINRFFIFVFIIFICCSYKKSIHCKLSDKIYIPYNKELCASKPIILVGKGGAMMGNIQEVTAHYDSFEKMNVDQARELYVEIVEGYIERYNQNEEIRPYLDNYPVTINNFDVMIGFDDPTIKSGRRHMRDGYVALVFYIKDRDCLYYEGYDPTIEKFYTLHTESYETARNLVLQQLMKAS